VEAGELSRTVAVVAPASGLTFYRPLVVLTVLPKATATRGRDGALPHGVSVARPPRVERLDAPVPEDDTRRPRPSRPAGRAGSHSPTLDSCTTASRPTAALGLPRNAARGSSATSA
jgi:hypothetical protein